MCTTNSDGRWWFKHVDGDGVASQPAFINHARARGRRVSAAAFK